MAWERRKYRKNKVWILVDDEGRPEVDERGFAQLRYKPEDERTYTVRPEEVRPLPAESEDDPGPVLVWAEAATTENSAGIGVVLVWGDRTREIARRLDRMPLPRAGVAAVVEALEAIRRPSLPVRVTTPHVEALNALRSGRGSATASPLTDALRHALKRFRDVKITDRDVSLDDAHATRALALAKEAARGTA